MNQKLLARLFKLGQFLHYYYDDNGVQHKDRVYKSDSDVWGKQRGYVIIFKENNTYRFEYYYSVVDYRNFKQSELSDEDANVYLSKLEKHWFHCAVYNQKQINENKRKRMLEEAAIADVENFLLPKCKECL